VLAERVKLTFRRIFLNVGANVGQNILNFKKLYGDDYENYEIFAFEPHPDNFLYLKQKFEVNPKVTLFQAGASNVDGEKKLYLGSSKSHTFREDKSTFMLAKDPIKVKSINLSKWIKNNFTKNDEIILYLDIEGEEYAVLQEMIDDNILDWIDELYVEFHEKKLNNLDEKQHDHIMQTLINTLKDKVYIHAKYQEKLYERLG
jgi:FkbM family methyltransferase